MGAVTQHFIEVSSAAGSFRGRAEDEPGGRRHALEGRFR